MGIRTISSEVCGQVTRFPAGNFSHVTLFQRGYEVEITLRRRLPSIQRRIDVVFPTSF